MYLGKVQRSGQEYVFPPGNLISLRAHGCGSQEREGGSLVPTVITYLATHMYERRADMLIFRMPYDLKARDFLYFQ